MGALAGIVAEAVVVDDAVLAGLLVEDDAVLKPLSLAAVDETCDVTSPVPTFSVLMILEVVVVCRVVVACVVLGSSGIGELCVSVVTVATVIGVEWASVNVAKAVDVTSKGDAPFGG